MNINRFGEVSDREEEESVERATFCVEPKKTHIIAINSHYTGPLRKDTFQFSFGGETELTAGKSLNKNPGFLIPHSGHIIKITMKTPITPDTLIKYFKVKGRVDLTNFDTGIFKIYNFKNYGTHYPEEIATITCKDAFEIKDEERLNYYYFNLGSSSRILCIEDNPPIFKPKVMGGDIINVATMVDLDIPIPEKKHYLGEDNVHRRNFFESEYFKKWGTPDLLNVYYLTILIELDPL